MFSTGVENFRNPARIAWALGRAGANAHFNTGSRLPETAFPGYTR